MSLLGINPGTVFSVTHSTTTTLLILCSAAVLGSLRLVERRGQDKRELDPRRQIEISKLIESMPEAVFIFDDSGKVIEVNSAAVQMFATSADDIKKFSARDISNYLAMRGQDRSSTDMVVRRALQGDTVRQERRTLALPRENSLVEALVSANPIRDDAGRVVGALIVVRDITELTVLQQKMADAERHNAIGKMAAGLAHDFNNVLDTISQAVSVLEIEPKRPSEERQLIVRMIRNAVRRGSEIVGGVRKFLVNGREETGAVDLNEVLEESVELTRPLWQANYNISIQRFFQPVRCVRANASELRRVFTNLIINSIEAMPQGGTLSVGCEQKPGKVIAFVEDTGQGIPENQKAHIFSPYFTTKEGGTGLGLAGAERTVHAQRGEISFESREGLGTRFTLEFPAESAQELSA
jgi:two-component system, cell cycle sensor histidine kinase and response regulator CckA